MSFWTSVNKRSKYSEAVVCNTCMNSTIVLYRTPGRKPGQLSVSGLIAVSSVVFKRDIAYWLPPTSDRSLQSSPFNRMDAFVRLLPASLRVAPPPSGRVSKAGGRGGNLTTTHRVDVDVPKNLNPHAPLGCASVQSKSRSSPPFCIAIIGTLLPSTLLHHIVASL